MQRSVVSTLLCPVCRKIDSSLTAFSFVDSSVSRISEGVLVCQNCTSWFPIERDMLELVPTAFFDVAAMSAFCQRHSKELARLNLVPPIGLLEPPAGYDAQVKQREHFDLYAENAAGFSDYTLIPFIKATSKRYINQWRSLLAKDARLLDVGCGTGIHTYGVMDRVTVLGFDIARKAVRKSIEGARERNLMERCTFFVADGSWLPIKDQSFEYVQTLGALHHLPNPEYVILDVQRVLKVGGIHFAVENNQSAFRGIFDALMRLWPLWIEEAGTVPLLSRSIIEQWLRHRPVTIRSETSIFLPPHLLNLFGRYAYALVKGSDAVFSRLPGFRNNGGQLVLIIEKNQN